MRFAAGTKLQAFPVIQEVFLVDCAKSKGIKRISFRANLETDPSLPPRWGQYTEKGFDKPYNMKDVLYEGLNAYAIRQQQEVDAVTSKQLGKKYPLVLPAPSTLAAEFACRVARAPNSTELVASELRRTGALQGLNEIICEIDLKDGNAPSEETVRFDESLGIAQFRGVWKTDVEVTPASIKFKDASFRYSISRTSGRLSVDSGKNDGFALTGNCAAASDRPRKF